MDEPNLDGVRRRIREIDEELLGLAAERQRLAREVGEIKRRLHLATVDYAQERAVLERARASAERAGLDPAVAVDLIARLIRASVTAQDEESLRFAGTGTGKRAVVMGGAGRMGRWMRRFLAAQGFQVGSMDPAEPGDEMERARAALPNAELVVCCAPPAVTAAIYRTWCAAPPRGVIADIASIKTPVVQAIRDLQAAGACVGSMHPMFGPSISLLRDADVVICDTGDAAAARTIEQLFQPTTARLVRMPLDEHDRLMADLLSLAHATAIAFALSLPPQEHPVRSTTFGALERLASAVVRESPDVYFEIQSSNPHSAAALERLRGSVERLVQAVASGDAATFAELMRDGQRRTTAR